MRARVPASSANLGPGFDTLALALSLYVEVEVEEADALTVRSEGEGSELPTDASHLAARVATRVAGHDRLAIVVRSSIPVGRGLGSSAALAAAAAAAAGASDPLAIAAGVDGHPENAAASVLGGLVTATTIEGAPLAARLPLDPHLRFVVLVPSRPLATARARQALPAQVPHADAAFNLGRMGILLAGLADRRLLVREATHLMAGLIDAGALASCWSGAGPTLLALCDQDNAKRVRARGDELLAETGVSGSALLLEADLGGLIVGDPPVASESG
jgi:homoserine kinase